MDTRRNFVKDENEQAGTGRGRSASAGIMKQIAERAGCAVSTVSRVINGNRKNFSVRPALERQILEIARELDYQPNPFLQSMRNQDSRVIAVFDPVLVVSAMLSQAKAGFLDEVRRAGYVAVGSYVQIYRLHEYMVPFPVVGALLFDISDRSFLSFFEKKAIPYVVVNGLCLENGFAVQVDETANAALLIDHLVECGHRKIAYYSAHTDIGTPGQHYSGILRQQGFDAGMRGHGLELPQADGDAIHAPAAFLRHHVLQNGVTAIVCYDYFRVQQIFHAAWELGLRVPEQLSIVCFDDDPSIERQTPPVTCCCFHGYEFGQEAGRRLVGNLCQGVGLGGTVRRIPGTLIKRQSVAVI